MGDCVREDRTGSRRVVGCLPLCLGEVPDAYRGQLDFIRSLPPTPLTLNVQKRRKLSFSLPKLSAEKSRADEAELRAQLAESQLAVALARAKLLEEQLARSEERASSAITTLVDLEERAADMESLASDAEERAAKAFAIALSNEAKFNELLHEYSRLARKKNVSTTPLMATGETKAREDKDGRKRSLRR